MRFTSLVAIATIGLFSCKTVEIGKQPVRTTVENTPTVNVANFPISGGTSNVKVTNATTDPVPVRVINQSSSNRQEAFYTKSAVTSVLNRDLKIESMAGHTLVIDYIHFTPADRSGLKAVIDAFEDSPITVITFPGSAADRTISEKVSIVLKNGQGVSFTGTLAEYGGTILVSYRTWKD